MRDSEQGRWHFWVDRGGTFTDVVAKCPNGDLILSKLLSDNPAQYNDAALEAIRRIMGDDSTPLSACDIRIGTTIATNALLERKGAGVLLAITQGFGDALSIGTQDRPNIFAREIIKPQPLYSAVIEIEERVTADGKIMCPLNIDAASAGFLAARTEGLDAIAIVLMHSYRFPAHELHLAKLAHACGFTQISVSHMVSPLIRLVGRGDTTVLDAYLSPVLRNYVDQITTALGTGAKPLFMQSNGALVSGTSFTGKNAILSGPAGGVVGMASTAQQAGFDRVIGFDMGGTSTDVALFDGSYQRDRDTLVAGVRIRAPMMRIHTIAAGGGSICRAEHGRMLVGPESAGAIPGPAAYRNGGPLTITDCNAVLGKLQPAFFPKIFGPRADEPLDDVAASDRLTPVAASLNLSAQAAAEGFVAIAVAHMARAIRAITIARGHDPADFALSCFGGAGGQHACLVADALNIQTVLIHPLAGVLSAYGMGLAQQGLIHESMVGLALDETQAVAIMQAAAHLETLTREELEADGVATASISLTLRAHIRPTASDNVIEVAFGAIWDMHAAFLSAFQARFGYSYSGNLIIDMIEAEALSIAEDGAVLAPNLPAQSQPPDTQVRIYLSGAWHETPVFQHSQLTADAPLKGPALILDSTTTTIIEPDWSCQLDRQGVMLLTRATPMAMRKDDAEMDPVRLEIFAGLFMGIAEDMGAALQRSAASVNIRERLDFSCAIFDAAGALIANAPHIPVHLGSMGDTVRAVMAAHQTSEHGIQPGDVFAHNAPYNGGTHLPDITLVMPVFVNADAQQPDFYVAARGHHADIGGIAPGSMPPDSRTIDEEGVLLDCIRIVADGVFDEALIRSHFLKEPWPARNISQNLADLSAQIAACMRGSQGLRSACATHGRGTVKAYMAHLQTSAHLSLCALLPQLHGGRFKCVMDDGAEICVAVRIDGTKRLIVDFTGTSVQRPNNFNAPLAVVRAAVLYVLRTLIVDNVPLNDGLMRAVELIVPQGSMLNPLSPAAVVAGNVETSQVIVDALFGALGVLAASQGTMNNFTFGNDDYQYYETIAGGAGAGPNFDGADAVQTHMTNSRLTDPEVLEARFPVLVEAFAIRHGSGGRGKHRGGNGVTRRIRFLEPLRAGILSNRRAVAPFGLDGGGDAAMGVNTVERAADGSTEVLGANASADMVHGDVFVIETPGGGGFGSAD